MTETRAPSAPLVELTGLSEQEAVFRLAARGPLEPPPTSRSFVSIVRANVFTVFNLILVTFGALTFVFGHAEDALFLGILVGNSGIGILQEWRAKRALDRLEALVAPHATVIRGGAARSATVGEVVVGDLVQVVAGDQIVADGRVEVSDGLLLDESILTGETEPVARGIGVEVRSGSFVAEGAGVYSVTAVGRESYAERVAGVARQFRHPRSPLELSLNRLLLVLVAVMIPLGAILGYALFEGNRGIREAVTTSVAGVVTLVPEGLILLASLTYAVAALRMARRGVLAQQLNAIESLASAEVICLDKTGTLTQATLRVVEVVPVRGVDPEFLQQALSRYAASSPSRNETLAAIREHLPGEAEPASGSIPFSSRRRWSGLRVGVTGYILGAPELFRLRELARRVEAEQDEGRRVLAIGTTAARLDGPVGPDESPPADIAPLGIVVLAEQLRPDARETVAFLLEQGISLKVISGDSPSTAGAIARDAGIPTEGGIFDGRDLPEDPAALRRFAQDAAVVGRISPQGKQRLVEALRDSGLYVVMVGDGVNDVPALKSARLAIAQGNGTQMAKSVADLVLVRGDFSAVPSMVAEGRKIHRNLQRVTKLFVAKSSFAAFLILTIGLTAQEYPLLPRHLTLAASIAIGFPAFFLALAPSAGPWRQPAFLRDVARFAIPAGTATGLGVVASYQFALNVLHLELVEARTVAVTVLIVLGLYLIAALEASGRVRGAAIGTLCIILLGLYGVILAFPGPRDFFDLTVPGLGAIFSVIGGTVLAIVGLSLTDGRFVPGRALSPHRT